MSSTKVVPLRIPAYLDEFASLSAREDHTDKATAFRQWLHRGAALHALELVADGRISLSYAAQQIDSSVWDLLALADTYGIELGPTDEQIRKSLDLARQL
jgi:hypothetical protein